MNEKVLKVGITAIAILLVAIGTASAATVTTNVTNIFANVTTPIQIVANGTTSSSPAFNGSVNVSVPTSVTITNGTFNYTNITNPSTPNIVTGHFIVNTNGGYNWINISLGGNNTTAVYINTTVNAPADSYLVNASFYNETGTGSLSTSPVSIANTTFNAVNVKQR